MQRYYTATKTFVVGTNKNKKSKSKQNKNKNKKQKQNKQSTAKTALYPTSYYDFVPNRQNRIFKTFYDSWICN